MRPYGAQRELIVMDVELPEGGHRTALVIFSGQAQLKGLRVLKPGFRHCFIALGRQGHWVIYNPLSHQTEISVQKNMTIDELMELYRPFVFKMIQCEVRKAPFRPAPLRPYTCVEAVKRILGIQKGWILTPWQLYRHLLGQKDKEGDTRETAQDAENVPFDGCALPSPNKRHGHITGSDLWD